MSPIHYLPLTPAFFAILVALFLVLVALIQIGILRYAYMRLGVSSGAALLLLLASLIGSYINIPIVQLPEQHILSGRHVEFFGMHYSVPVVIDWPGTVIAINVGGALIPTLISLYLLAKNQVWALGLIATACVGAVCYWCSRAATPRRSLMSAAAWARWSGPTCSTSAESRDSERRWPRSEERAPSTASF
jgi:uncharacterized membrane protein